MSQPTHSIAYTGTQVGEAIGKILGLKTFEFAAETTEFLNSKTFHVFWKIAPTLDNEVVGFTIHPDNGQLCEVISAIGSTVATAIKTYAPSPVVEDDTLILSY